MADALMHATRIAGPLHCVDHRIQRCAFQLIQMLPPPFCRTHVRLHCLNPLDQANAVSLQAVPLTHADQIGACTKRVESRQRFVGVWRQNLRRGSQRQCQAMERSWSNTKGCTDTAAYEPRKSSASGIPCDSYLLSSLLSALQTFVAPASQHFASDAPFLMFPLQALAMIDALRSFTAIPGGKCSSSTPGRCRH